MAAYVNANNAFSTLAGDIAADATSFTVSVGTSFPVVRPGDWTFVTFQDTANNIEIMKITEHGDGTDSFTCVRAQENTVARAWLVGDFVECRFTAGITVTTDKVQTLTNKTLVGPVLRFSDGTLAAPGITWANETTTGFARTAPNTMVVSINTQNVMQWQPSATVFNAPAYWMNSSSLNFRNAGNDAWWEVLHANSSNNLYIGRIGWANTYIYGGANANIHVHSSGVSFFGTVYGITAAMVGLGNVTNNRQIYNLYGNANNVYIGWAGGKLEAKVDDTPFGPNWPINITGSSASCTGNAATASTAANSLNICNIGGWRYANMAKNPVYLWATDGNTQDQFLVQPGNLTVAHANTATTATSTNAVSGVGINNLVRTNDASITNLRVWTEPAVYDDRYFEITSIHGTYNIRLTNNGGGPTAMEKVRTRTVDPADDDASLALKAIQELTARIEALEARAA